MKVQRYDPKYVPYTNQMMDDSLGGYVKYEDYEKLEAQNKELIEALQEIADQKLDGRSGVMIQSDMKVIAYRVLKTNKK